MSERETGFENAKVGDRCYSPIFKNTNTEGKTNAVIIAINIPNGEITVKPDIALKRYSAAQFLLDGSYNEGGGQVLFWGNPIEEKGG